METLKEKKAEFLAEVLRRCLNREPCLTKKELAIIIAMELGDISKEIKREAKK